MSIADACHDFLYEVQDAITTFKGRVEHYA
jgi:hypothetical protein